MAIVTVTTRQWQSIFAPRVRQKKRVRRHNRKGFVYRFHITHRQTAGNNGPGRRHKRG